MFDRIFEGLGDSQLWIDTRNAVPASRLETNEVNIGTRLIDSKAPR